MKITVDTYNGEVDLIAILPDGRIFCETQSDYVVWYYQSKPFKFLQCTCGNYYPKHNHTYEQALALVQEKYGPFISSRD